MKKLFSIIFVFVYAAAFAATTYNADVVVVGAGGSGNAAAIQAGQLGAKVILLEKMPAVGGNANFCEGIFAAESRLQKDLNLPDVSKEHLFKVMMDYNKYKGDARLITAFVNKSPDTIDWLADLGVEYDGVFLESNMRTYTWHRFTGLCTEMTRTLVNQFPKYNVELKLESRATEIIMKNGKAVGVKAVNEDDGEIVINAKAVIIGTGGFINNEEMLLEYAEYKGAIKALGAKGRTGDGIKMALAAGAMADGLGGVQYHSPSPKGGPLPAGAGPRKTSAAFNQPNFWINPDGQRFVDESVSGAFAYAGNASIRQKDGLVVKLADQAAIDYYAKEGPDFFGGHGRRPFTTLPKDIEDDVKAGLVVKADNINELVKKMNSRFGTKIKADVFKETVEQVNKAYEANFDFLFYKERQFLRPFKTAPFYAVATYPAALGTVGGIKITEHCEAVDTEFKVIPGLYVIGTDAGGMYGDTYNIIVAGETIGFAVNSGRMAAEHAVKTYVK